MPEKIESCMFITWWHLKFPHKGLNSPLALWSIEMDSGYGKPPGKNTLQEIKGGRGSNALSLSAV